jgi:hypothetical protein
MTTGRMGSVDISADAIAAAPDTPTPAPVIPSLQARPLASPQRPTAVK